MTFVGKILVVVQVFLSLCFMAFAGAVFTVQQNWKQEAEKAQADTQSVRTELAELETQHKAYQQDQAARLTAETNRAQKAEADAVSAQQDFARANADLQKARDELANQRALAEIATSEAAERAKEATTLRTVNKKLHDTIDELTVSLRQLEDEVFSKNVTVRSIQQKHTKILGRLALAERALRHHNIDPQDVRDESAPPPIVEGYVLATRKTDDSATEFIEISLGSDDGVAKGHNLYIYRSEGTGKYLGKIQLVLVTPDRAVGTVIDKAKIGIIQRGDNVTTKL